MPIKQFRVGTQLVKDLYVGTSKVKLGWLDDSLVYEQPMTLTISKATGISSITYSATRVDGSTYSGSLTYATSATFGYGTVVTFSCSVSTGYTKGSYTSSVTMTQNRTATFNATPTNYTTYIRMQYGSTIYSDIGTFSYSTNGGTTWSTSGSANVTAPYGSTVQVKFNTAVAGFAGSSAKYNGTTLSASNGIYSFTVAAGTYYCYMTYTASATDSTISFTNATATTNSLSRSAFTVTCSFTASVAACSAGTVLGTVPAAYRPKSAVTFTTNWYQVGTSASNTATITIDTNGNITSDKESQGSGTGAAGGKWGSTTYTYTTSMTCSNLTWTVA